ncbi:MAG TPA: hypothetical protein VF077_09425 [Nitrospiraceae bacterium]
MIALSVATINELLDTLGYVIMWIGLILFVATVIMVVWIKVWVWIGTWIMIKRKTLPPPQPKPKIKE